ncbi:N-terminal domain of NEFA-interacting nuclear protein NIP30-domain-containing protein [Xylaria intraflava]|nr:N-terminal domain of NEFA-interacting nuclear protein NIP30-domain-containing protein [Xylaria intraflava]
MTSRFVSGGVIAGDDDAGDARVESGAAGKNSVAWEAVQRDLEAERRSREESRRVAVEGGSRSLFEVLQANKAAKQAAFEEQNRLRNQFRALDEDEIEFLSGVRDEERAEEERVRRETEEGLAGFRKARMGSGGGSADVGGDEAADGDAAEESWGAEWTAGSGRKRKREKERDKGRGLKGVKRRSSLSGDAEKPGGNAASDDRAGLSAAKSGDDDAKASPVETDAVPAVSTAAPTKVAETEPKPKPALGLVNYGSDDDDDDDD